MKEKLIDINLVKSWKSSHQNSSLSPKFGHINYSCMNVNTIKNQHVFQLH